MSISVMILTLNEEANLPGCLKSVDWCDDVVVFDSFSGDRTPDLAREKNARVIQRKFDNWAAHQNWAMENIEFKNDWVFYLDADERMTPDLNEEIHGVAANPDDPHVAYYCGRKNYFMGRWIKHAMSPGMIMRFFKPPHIRFERLVNPVPVVDGSYGYLQHLFEHYNFSKGFTEWFDKHNNYSSFEALEGMKVLKNSAGGSMKMLRSKDPALRRRALKNITYRLPIRPWVKFWYLYLFKRGFLDGAAGYTYCRLQAIYEYMIVLKMRELQRAERGLTI